MGDGLAARDLGYLATLGGIKFAVETCKPAGQGGEGVGIAFAEGDAEEEFIKLDGGLLLQRAGIGLVTLAHAHGVHDDEMGLHPGVRAADGLQIRGGEDAGAATFHLLEIDAAADIAQEEEAFERLDVRAGGDHVHGNGNAELRRGAEFLDEVLGLGWFAGGRVLGLVGDFFAEIIAPAKDLAANVDDVLGVGIVLGEDEGLGNECAAWKEFGEQGIFERLKHGADLGRHNDGAVQFGRGIGEVFVELLPALGAI